MSDRDERQKSPRRIIRLLGVYHIVVAFLLAHFLITALSSMTLETALGGNGKIEKISISFLWGAWNPTLSYETGVMLLVMIVGALGSFIHGATSFATYVGNRQLVASWSWWYMLRPFIGMSLAIIFYFMIRGGLLSAGASAGDLSLFGMLAIAGITGLFAKQATDKLREVFDMIFRLERNVGRADSLEISKPVVTSVEPTSLHATVGEQRIDIFGEGFVEASKVMINGEQRNSEMISKNQLKCQLLPRDIAQPCELEVLVVNPSSGGGMSQSVKLSVFEVEQETG